MSAPSGRRLGDARQDLEQRALAGAVAADDADDLALLDLERHVLQRPEASGPAGRGVRAARASSRRGRRGREACRGGAAPGRSRTSSRCSRRRWRSSLITRSPQTSVPFAGSRRAAGHEEEQDHPGADRHDSQVRTARPEQRPAEALNDASHRVQAVQQRATSREPGWPDRRPATRTSRTARGKESRCRRPGT